MDSSPDILEGTGYNSATRVGSHTSLSSKHSSVRWMDQTMSPTFHNVQVEQVKIVQRDSELEKLRDVPKDKPSSAEASSIMLRVVAPPPSEEGSMGTNNSEERRTFREIYLRDANKSRERSEIQSRKERMMQVVEVPPTPMMRNPNKNSENVPLVNLPLAPVGTAVSREQTVYSSHRQSESAAVKNQRQKLAVIRHMQRLQANESPQQMRLMSSNNKNKKIDQKASPDLLTTDKQDHRYSQTAPESGFGYYEAEIDPEFYNDRLKTAPHVSKSIIWTAKNRVNSSRALSSASSYKLRLNELEDMQSNGKANTFIKLPFKQTPFVTMNGDRSEFVDNQVQPDYELRLTTAFTVSQVRKALKQMPNTNNYKPNNPGKLIKGKLATLRPVKVAGPTIKKCQGIQPETPVKKTTKSYTPSPSRQQQLKDQLNQAYETHRLRQAEYERRMIRAQSATSGESVHRTSPAPDHVPEIPPHSFVLNELTGLTDNSVAAMSGIEGLQFSQLESGVIY